MPLGGPGTGSVFTWGELAAARLLGGWEPHKAGNEIIAFAERIKAERAVMAMDHAA